MKKYLLWLGLLILISTLWGCTNLWAPAPPDHIPKLIFGPPVVEGDHGKIVVSVVDMPQDGVGAIAVEFGGIIYPTAKMSDFQVKGVNGLQALAWDFHDGKGGFVAVSTTAIASGPVAVISFTVTGPVGSGIVVYAAKISLASAHNTLIQGFKISQPAYYAR
jgi:hypothetical protein